MAKIPIYFTGSKFMAKYGITDPRSFHIDDELVCPAFPNLTDSDLLDCVETQAERDAMVATALRKTNAKTEAALAIALKSLTPAQAITYIDTTVTNIASAKTVLKVMVRMLIAMRDEVWPDLLNS
jgi:hypothetical protein